MVHILRGALCNFKRKFLENFVHTERKKTLEIKTKLISDGESQLKSISKY